MGLTCKPIGKLASMHRKVQNEQLKEKAAQVAKKSKKQLNQIAAVRYCLEQNS